MRVERYYAGATVAPESQMKRHQSKQPKAKPALKAKPKPPSVATKPRGTATKSVTKKAPAKRPLLRATSSPKAPRATSPRKPAAVPRQPANAVSTAASAPIPVPVSADTPKSKQSQLIALLGNGPGATMAQMMSLTGWQAHTVRGAISGALRKRLGLNVQNRLEEGVRIYRITQASAA